MKNSIKFAFGLALALILLPFASKQQAAGKIENEFYLKNDARPFASARSTRRIETTSAPLSPSRPPAAASVEVPELIKDIFPGASSSYMSINGAPAPQPPVEAGGVLFFIADDGVSGRELWRTDGTAVGTYQVKDIFPGPSGSSAFPPQLVNVGGIIFFKANDGSNGAELWRSDGTEAGTFMVKDITLGPGGSNPRDIVNVGGTLFFSAQDMNGVELWRSDGTAGGTMMVIDIVPGSVSSDPGQLTSVGGTLCFFAASVVQGREIFRSDGTATGTFMVKDIYPFTSSSVVQPDSLIDVSGTLFFYHNDGNGYGLWRSDGTGLGTSKVSSQVLPVLTHGQFTQIVSLGSALYFAADHPVDHRGTELWRSDGTEAGTFMVKDMRPGIESSGPQDLFVYGGAVYFRATEGTLGSELWRSDGTEAGTYLVKDCALGGGNGQPDFFVEVGGTLFFTAVDTFFGTEIWQSDGTADGTFRVTDLPPASLPPQSLVGFGRTIVFTAQDGVHGREPWILSLANLPPVTVDDTATTDEETAITISVLANDTDPDGDTFSLSEVTPPAHGSATINPDNSVSYSPFADFNGTDSFTYIAVDEEGNPDTANVTVNVNPVNDPPVAVGSSETTDEDMSVSINLSATDVDNPDLTFAIVDKPLHGTLFAVNGSSVIFTPDPNFSGSDSFSFKVSDGTSESNVASVSITVAAVNDAPGGVADAVSTTEDAPVDVSVLANDTDIEGDALTVTAATNGTHGSVAINPDGTITYTPSPNFFGSDSFTYNISDGHDTATGTVNVTIEPVNDAPTAGDIAVIVSEDGQIEITLPASDIDSPSVNFILASAPANGTLSAIVNGKVIYTPDPDYSGSDCLTFIVNDGALDSNIAAVSISVTPLPDSPVLATIGDQVITEGALLSLALSATDPDGEQLIFSADGLPDGATFNPSTGAFSWTPDNEDAGTYSISFTVSDPTGRSASENITITVADVVTNLGPICSATYPGISEIWPPNHREVPIGIFGITDPDNDPITISIRQILQDEPTNTNGDGNTPIDGGGVGTAQAWVRAERSVAKKVGGNGRVYEIFFEASDNRGKSCTGSVKVGVPHNQGHGDAVDDGKRYDSTVAGGPCLNCNP